MKKEKVFIKGETVKYTGRGFVGFDPNDPFFEFISYDGPFDAMIKYKDSLPILVSKYDLEPVSKKKK